MSNPKRVQKQKECATTMEVTPDFNDSFQQIITLIQTKLDSQVILTEIAIIVGKYFQADICLIVATSGSTPTSQSGFWHRDNSFKFTNNTSKQLLLNPLIKGIMAQGELIALADLGNNAQLIDLLSVKSILAMGTHLGSEVNGIVLLGFAETHVWTQQEQQLFQRFAQLVAISNEIVHPHTEIPDNFNPNLLLNSGSRSIPGDNLIKKWYQLTRQQLEQQRQLNELKDEIITVISHEAGTPLATMKLAIEILCNRQDTLPSESQQRYWNILKQEWQRLYDLIANIKTLQQLESEELSFNPQQVDLYFIFKDMVQLFSEQWQGDKRKRLNLVTEGLLPSDFQSSSDISLTIYTDPQHIRSILLELLTNAGKFAAPLTTVYLKVTEQEQGKQKNLIITVTNIGLGISPQEQLHIFEPFRRGQGMTNRAIPGIGLGLTLVKGLVELLGGRIEVASHPLEDSDNYVTSFTITLSQAQS